MSIASRKTAAEEIRLRYHYRSMVLREKTNLSFEAALRLIGPDCAYRLYSAVDLKKLPGTRKRSEK